MTKQVWLAPGNLPEGLVVVKFSKSNCAPCSVLTPLFDELDYGDKVELLTINPEESFEWVSEMGIRTVPTTIGFKDNKEIFRVKGVDIDSIKENINKYI